MIVRSPRHLHINLVTLLLLLLFINRTFLILTTDAELCKNYESILAELLIDLQQISAEVDLITTNGGGCVNVKLYILFINFFLILCSIFFSLLSNNSLHSTRGGISCG